MKNTLATTSAASGTSDASSATLDGLARRTRLLALPRLAAAITPPLSVAQHFRLDGDVNGRGFGPRLRMLSAPAGQDERVPDGSERPGHESAELVGQLARELSALVRRDLEVAATERLPTLRRALLDLAVVGTVAVAVLFTLGALSVAGGGALATLLPGWAAALLIAGLWGLIALVVAAVLLRPRAQPREREELVGLLQILARHQHLEELRSSREDARDEAESEMRQTAAELVTTLLDEAAEHQVKALPAVAKREVGKAEADAAELVADALALLAAPARAGWNVLGRLVEPPAAGARPTADRPPRTRRKG
jgi:Putative Actinobacterial Holin-X, holin superfamily III